MLLIDAISSELIGAAVETTVWTSRQTDHGACPGDPWSRFLDVDDRRTTSERRASFVGRPDAHEQLCHGIGLRQPEGFLGGAMPREPAAGDWLARGSHPIQTGRRCPPGRPESSGG